MSRPIHCRSGVTVTELLVVIAVIGILMSLLMPAVQLVRESARKTMCANNLRQIGMAFTSHAVTYQNYPSAGLNTQYPRSMSAPPPNGDPLPYNLQSWGWAYQILPYLDQDSVHRKIDDAAVASASNPNYFCPSRRRPEARPGIDCGLPAQSLRGALDYAGNGGNGILKGTRTPSYPASEAWIRQNGTVIPIGHINAANVFVPSSIRVGPGVKDGDQFTILVGERNFNRQRRADPAQYDEDNGYVAGYSWDSIRWGYDVPAPDRLDGSNGDTRFGSSHGMTTQFVFCDGGVRSISYDVNLQVFQGLCACEDGNSPDESNY